MTECIKSCTGTLEHHRGFGPLASVVFLWNEKDTDKNTNTKYMSACLQLHVRYLLRDHFHFFFF